MVIEGDLTLESEHPMQYTEGVLQNCTLDPYIILLNNASAIHLIKKIYFKGGKKESKKKCPREVDSTLCPMPRSPERLSASREKVRLCSQHRKQQTLGAGEVTETKIVDTGNRLPELTATSAVGAGSAAPTALSPTPALQIKSHCGVSLLLLFILK